MAIHKHGGRTGRTSPCGSNNRMTSGRQYLDFVKSRRFQLGRYELARLKDTVFIGGVCRDARNRNKRFECFDMVWHIA